MSRFDNYKSLNSVQKSNESDGMDDWLGKRQSLRQSISTKRSWRQYQVLALKLAYFKVQSEMKIYTAIDHRYKSFQQTHFNINTFEKCVAWKFCATFSLKMVIFQMNPPKLFQGLWPPPYQNKNDYNKFREIFTIIVTPSCLLFFHFQKDFRPYNWKMSRGVIV